ncbi:MAG: hypothetical protein DMD51_12890 [Gemmatimonadetes bacterium]|nr:MAG: hypothetical protein DMD32_11845 [Gemmatimonadota bacterium]PYP23890.1 MAG: hypothetical protein DMD51_12890 [Gemmatimonadota bacterium]
MEASMTQRLALLLFTGALVAARGPAQQTTKAPLKAVAHNLVTSTMLKEGQTLLISGSVRDLPLMEDLAVEAQKIGLQPMLSLWSERLIRRSYDEVPAKYDDQQPTVGMGLAKLFDGQIAIDYGETEGLLKGVPPERIAARSKANAPVFDAFLKRNTHFVNLGNGLYPTRTLARRLGISQARLAAGFWKALAVPPEQVAAAAERLRAVFAGGKTVRLTHPNGTSLSFDVTDRTPTISAGALTEKQVEQGGAALLTWLPAGEFQIAAVPGSAEGKVVIDRSLWRGQIVKGLTLVFSQGKLTGMSAASGLALFKADYDAGGSGKDLFGLIDIGLNPGINVPLATGAIVWPQAGAVTVVLGNDLVGGGSNNSDFGYAGQLGGASVTVDDKPVVVNGRLK